MKRFASALRGGLKSRALHQSINQCRCRLWWGLHPVPWGRWTGRRGWRGRLWAGTSGSAPFLPTPYIRDPHHDIPTAAPPPPTTTTTPPMRSDAERGGNNSFLAPRLRAGEVQFAHARLIHGSFADGANCGSFVHCASLHFTVDGRWAWCWCSSTTSCTKAPW